MAWYPTEINEDKSSLTLLKQINNDGTEYIPKEIIQKYTSILIICEKGGYSASSEVLISTFLVNQVYYVGGIIGNYGSLFCLQGTPNGNNISVHNIYAFIMSQTSNTSNMHTYIYGRD